MAEQTIKGFLNAGEREKSYDDKIKDWNEKAKTHKIISHKQEIFYRIMIIGFFLLLLVTVYLIYEDRFKSEVTTTINPLFNATVNTDNKYDFNPTTENKYTNNNNFNFTFNIDEELIKSLCNTS